MTDAKNEGPGRRQDGTQRQLGRGPCFPWSEPGERSYAARPRAAPHLPNAMDHFVAFIPVLPLGVNVIECIWVEKQGCVLPVGCRQKGPTS